MPMDVAATWRRMRRRASIGSRSATGAYLARIGRTSIYPEISITFNCSGKEHYHLPLLLSDNSYTTYRGS